MRIFISALLMYLLFGCAPSEVHTPAQRFITDQLPKGVLVYGFDEQYDKYKGEYELRFFLKNETGKRIEYPQIDGDIFIDGKLDGPVTGGPGKHLNHLDSGVVSLATILPTRIPDSVVFKFIQ